MAGNLLLTESELCHPAVIPLSSRCHPDLLLLMKELDSYRDGGNISQSIFSEKYTLFLNSCNS